MESNANRRMRKRITSPRTSDEAHELIRRIKAEFNIVDAEDQYEQAMSAQQAMYAETLHQYVKAAAGAAMQAAGITSLTIRNDVFRLDRRIPVNSEIDQATQDVKFILLPEGARTDDEILADAKLLEIDAELAQATAQSFHPADQATDENYALPGDQQ